MLKTLGASPSQIRRASLVTFAVAGGFAALAAAAPGALAAAVTIQHLFHADGHFERGIIDVALLGSVGSMRVFGYISAFMACADRPRHGSV